MTQKKTTIRDMEDVILKVQSFGEDIEKDSTQLPPDEFDTATIVDKIVKPLYDPLVWALLLEQNTRLKRLIDTMALNTVGLGWVLAPKLDSEEFLEENKAKIEEERARIGPLFEMPNPEDPFSEVMRNNPSFILLTRIDRARSPVFFGASAATNCCNA